MFAHATGGRHAGDGSLAVLTLDVANLDDSHPQLGTDESYSLTVGSSGASLCIRRSKSVSCGAL